VALVDGLGREEESLGSHFLRLQIPKTIRSKGNHIENNNEKQTNGFEEKRKLH
jgi:hypothetical protein